MVEILVTRHRAKQILLLERHLRGARARAKLEEIVTHLFDTGLAQVKAVAAARASKRAEVNSRDCLRTRSPLKIGFEKPPPESFLIQQFPERKATSGEEPAPPARRWGGRSSGVIGGNAVATSVPPSPLCFLPPFLSLFLFLSFSFW